MRHYFSIAVHEAKTTVVDHGYCRDDAHAIRRSTIDANGRINSPGYYGSPLVSYRTLALDIQAPIVSKADLEPVAARVLAGEGEPLSHETWGNGHHISISDVGTK